MIAKTQRVLNGYSVYWTSVAPSPMAAMACSKLFHTNSGERILVGEGCSLGAVILGLVLTS